MASSRNRLSVVAEINEQLDGRVVVVAAPVPSHYRLVLQTQYRENYGAHSWDGKGECPSYWKNKGGVEYHVQIGSARELLALGKAGIDALVKRTSEKLTYSNDYSSEHIIGWSIYSDVEQTPDEEMQAYYGDSSPYHKCINL